MCVNVFYGLVGTVWTATAIILPCCHFLEILNCGLHTISNWIGGGGGEVVVAAAP